ncbi:hypothetical protein ACFSL4_30150 [Streptomyces caeni]|uniref:Uncharacterized protein n=1 Tax=Streptomyces caeni TaxID=2307231 RepID=A0ABW4IY96_9ACTN
MGDPAGEVGHRRVERFAPVHAERLGARDRPAPRALGKLGCLGAALAHLVPPAAHRTGDEQHPDWDAARAADQFVQQRADLLDAALRVVDDKQDRGRGPGE